MKSHPPTLVCLAFLALLPVAARPADYAVNGWKIAGLPSGYKMDKSKACFPK